MTDVLHVMQASLQFSDPEKVQRRDLHTIYGRGADVIGHTESADMHDLLVAVAKEHGYKIVQPANPATGKRVSTAFAVRNTMRVKDSSYVNVVPGQPGLARLGGHDPRGFTTVDLAWAGNDLSLTEFHALTGWGHGDPERDAQILDQWRVTATAAARMGRGSDLSILMGDTNYDPDDPSPNAPDEILAAHGWVSAYTELGRPDLPTHGKRTIDQIYSLRRDKRLSVRKAKRWDDETGIDHQQVSVWFSVAPRRRPNAR